MRRSNESLRGMRNASSRIACWPQRNGLTFSPSGSKPGATERTKMACSRTSGTLESEVEVDVLFHDSDPMGVTWHGNYFRYLESARAALLGKIGYSYSEMVESGYLWPVVEAHIKYLKPTRFGQRL